MADSSSAPFPFPFPFAIQLHEFHLDSLAASDRDLAYHLQLEEALAASAAMAAAQVASSSSSSSSSSTVAKEISFPPADCFRTFQPVASTAVAAGASASASSSSSLAVKESIFPPMDHTFVHVSAMAAGGLSSKGKEGFLSADCFGAFVPGLAMAAGGSSLKKGEVEGFPSIDHSLALSLQSLELSRSQEEAVDCLRAASEAEQNRAKICQTLHNAELACRIHKAPDHKWEECGDFLKSSLESAPPTPPPPSHLYFTSIHHGGDKDAPSSSSTSPTAASFMGMVILDASGNVVMEMKKPLGSPSSKIKSDYMALILSLEGAQSAGFQHVQVCTDSVLLYNQVKGKWKVYSSKILTLWSQVMMYIHKFQGFELHLLVKNENQHATRLARDAINSKPLAGSKNASSLHDNIRNVNEEVLEDCTICLEERAGSVMVTVAPCSHRFCMSCVVQHMEVKVQAGKVPVQCPHLNCKSSFSLEQCKAALSQKWFELLMRAMREVSIPEQERVYCPFPRCSALMLKKDLERTFQVTSSSSSSSSLSNSYLYNCVTCVECRRFFCHYCRAPWHNDMSCEEYQNSPLNGQNSQEAYLYSLARDHKWQRCKKCRRMIELAEGCYHITCRCGHEFCYVCGSEWVDKKQTCKCRLWDEQNLIREPAGQNIAAFVRIMADIDSDGSDQSDGEFYDDDDDDNENDNEDIESLDFDRQQAASNPFYKTKLCRYHERGNCWEGRNCEFAHGMHELRDEQNLIQQPAGQNIDGFVGIMADIDSDGSDQSDGEFYDDDDDENDDEDIESLHFEREQTTTNPFYKTKLCWHYESGYCWAGRNCKFAHGMHDLR